MDRTPDSADRFRRLATLGAAARNAALAHRYRLLAAFLALLASAAVLLVAREVFPYHSPNHDEAVYLQGAAMLLEGRLALRPPVPEAMRPWFFVRDGGLLYPKYAPVPAAVFALGEALVGSVRASLAAVAALNVALCYAVASEAFDRRTGVLAAALLLASPLFLVNSAVFLPYAPTATLNLVFAFAYLRAARRNALDSTTIAYAAIAGVAIGLAFFARPYTAVLFAVPFLLHATWQCWATGLSRPTLARHGTTAILGLAGVALTLVYNVVLTGSPLVFPYEAFAPLDGLGFGRREILGYARDYTPGLALRANAEAVRLLLTRWVVAGPLGALLAVAGLVAAFGGRRSRPRPRGLLDASAPSALSDRQVRLLLAGVLASVLVGNLYFWGTLNVLDDLAVPDDGLVALLGPYYHFDALVPLAAFAAHGSLAIVARVRRYLDRFPAGRARALGVACLLVAGTAFGVAGAAVVADPLEENAAIADRYERAYAPFDDAEFEDALVLLPTPYGDWLAHPFQTLRNDPGFDGPAVYALDRGERNFAVLDAYPERAVYRYAYRGDWAPTTGATVDAHLQRVEVVEDERVDLAADLGVPAGADGVTVRLATDDGGAYYTLDGLPDAARLRLSIVDGHARLAGPDVRPVGAVEDVPVESTDEVVVETFVDHGAGTGFSYRLELPIEVEGGTVRAMTPVVEICRVLDRCGGEAAYVPDAMDPGVSVDLRLTAEDREPVIDDG